MKFEGIEGGNIGIAFVYVLNIPKDYIHIWLLMASSLPKVQMGY